MTKKVCEKEKRRVIVEIAQDDFESLLVLKRILSISWRDMLIAGAIWWTEQTNIEKFIDNLKNTINNIAQTKN